MAGKQPNILIVMADQLAPQWCSAYGGPAKTPHLERLVARGRRFDAAYCNAPLCAPSRASLMTGQLPSRIGAYDNASDFASSEPTFAHYLNSAGYRTCLAGRMHFVGPDQRHGFGERLTTDIYPADFAWTPDWTDNETRIDGFYHNMSSVLEAGTATATFQIDYDEEVGFTAQRWLYDHLRSGDARPFCLMASFMHPHDPYVAKPQWWSLYDAAEIPRPQVARPDPEDPFSTRLMDGAQASVIEPTEEQIVNARQAYFANASYFDSKIGALVQILEETGTLDDTLIVVISDHGDMLGERGLWYKMSFFEHSARVPIVLAGPGVGQGPSDRICSLVDILPTLLDAGGYDGPVAEPLDGTSLLGAGPSQAIGEYCAEMAGHPVVMIRRDQWKYVHCDSDPPQLFDLTADPQELRNLASDPAHAETARAFADEVAQRWNMPELTAAVISSQHRRRAVHAGMEAAPPAGWDHTPHRDASQEYVRNHIDWTVAAARLRFPPLQK